MATLKEMEKYLAELYGDAQQDLSKKWNEYMSKANKELKSLQDALNAAQSSGDPDEIKIAKYNLQKATREVTLMDDRYNAMVKQTAGRYADVNKIALNYVNGEMANIYTIHYNDAGNDIEKSVKGYAFDLVDENTVKKLANEDKIILPEKKLDPAKDVPWNVKQINSQVMQGILQGESIPDMAKRLQNVTNQNLSSSIRNARTMATSAENSGRLDSYKQASEDGVIMKKVWMAAHDDRTRESHADLDGEEVEVDEPFSNGLMYPGDPNGDPAEVYNCRCTMVTRIVGFKPIEQPEELTENNENIGGLSKQDLDATKGYTNTTSASIINAALRKSQDTSKYDEVINRLDAHMEKTNETMVVYREVNVRDMVESILDISPSENTFESLREAAIGTTFSDKGFMSCYYEKTENSYGSAVMAIEAMPGTEAILTSNDAEKEVILGRNQDWMVTDVTMEDGKFVFHITNDMQESSPAAEEKLVEVSHMTKAENAEKILKEGFDLSKAGETAGDVWGGGAYFTTEEMEKQFYGGRSGSEEITATVNTSGMLEVDIEGAQDKTKVMYNNAAKSFTEEEQKDYKKLVREYKKEEPNPEKKAFVEIASENYPGIIIRQTGTNGIDPLTGGNQIVVFDTRRIKNISGGKKK